MASDSRCARRIAGPGCAHHLSGHAIRFALQRVVYCSNFQLGLDKLKPGRFPPRVRNIDCDVPIRKSDFNCPWTDDSFSESKCDAWSPTTGLDFADHFGGSFVREVRASIRLLHRTVCFALLQVVNQNGFWLAASQRLASVPVVNLGWQNLLRSPCFKCERV